MTKEQICEIKKDPYVQILSSIAGISVDEMIKEFEKDQQVKSESLDKEDDNPTYPLCVGELKQLVYNLQDLFRNSYQYKNIGIDLQQVELWCKTMSVIEDLLEIIFDEDCANVIMDEISCIDNDPDNIAYDIIDYLNTRDNE